MASRLPTMDEGTYQLSWEGEERANALLGDYRTLLISGDFHDVTLLTEDDQLIRAHRVVLAACSPFFRNVFSKTSVANLHLYMHGQDFNNLTAILGFMYSGSTQVTKYNLNNPSNII